MTVDEQDILYWFLKECVGNVQCRWGPCAIGQKRNNRHAVLGVDLYTNSIHGSDVGMAVAAMKHYKDSWNKTTPGSTKMAFFVDEDEEQSDDEEMVVLEENSEDGESTQQQGDEESTTGKKSRKKVKTQVYHACWSRHSEKAINSIHGVKKQDPDHPQDKSKKILVDAQGKKVTPEELKNRYAKFNKFMKDRLIMEIEGKLAKKRKNRGSKPSRDAEAVATVTQKKKMRCVTDNENFFNGSKWKWSEAITAKETV